jgi:hypothetical protein
MIIWLRLGHHVTLLLHLASTAQSRSPDVSPRCTPPGAPPANATLFCEPTSNLCFTYNSGSHNFSSSRAACVALGGDLVLYDSVDKQLRVENYFESQGSLTHLYYWIGASRANASAKYTLLDGTAMPQSPSESPYAHWNWYQPISASHQSYSCVMAYNAYR